MTTKTLDDLAAYEADVQSWRQRMDERLRAADGWLTLTGLYWLHGGKNTVGSDPSSDIRLPDSTPKQLGFVEFADGVATLHVTADAAIANVEANAVLRDDEDAQGATRVEVDSVTFFVIKRGDAYGVRVRDRNHPARLSFRGRQWLPIDPAYRITATYTAYPQPRILDVPTVADVITPTENPGYVEFDLGGQHLHFEAFSAGQDELWFVFSDASPLTYDGGRFLYAPLHADGTATLDFNKAYNPPCAFTAYAPCQLPPEANIVTSKIEAGETAPADRDQA